MHLRFQEIRALRRQKKKGDSVGQWHPCHKHRTELDDAVSYSVPWWPPRTWWQTHSVRQALDGTKKWCPHRQLVVAQLGLRLQKIQSVQRNYGFGVLQTIFLTYQFFSQPLGKLSSSLFRDTVRAGAGVEVLVGEEPLLFRDVGWTSGLRLAQEDGHPVGKDCILPPCPSISHRLL